MKLSKRKIGFLLLLTFSFLIYLWYYTPIKQIIKTKLIEDIENAANSKIKVEMVDINLGIDYIGMDSVKIIWGSKDKPTSIQIPQVRVHYSVFPLLIFKTSLNDLIDHISIEQPNITIPFGSAKKNGLNKKNNAISYSSILTQLEKMHQLLKIHKSFPDIKINDASVEIKTKDSQISFFNQLNGTIFINEQGNLICSLSERNIFRQKKMDVNFSFLVDQKLVSSKFSFNSYQLKNIKNTNAKSATNITNGILNGKFSVKLPLTSQNKPTVKSDLYFTNLEGKLFKKYFVIENLDIKSENGFVLLNSSPALWNSNEISLWAAIQFNPNFKASFKLGSPNFDVSSLNEYFVNGKSPIRGKISVQGDLNYDFNNGVTFDGFVESSKIFLGKTKWEKLAGRVNYENKYLNLNINQLSAGRFSSKLNGTIDLSKSDINLNILAKYSFKNSMFSFAKKLKKANLQNSIRLSGNIKKMQFNADSKHFLINQQDTLLSYLGAVKVKSDSLQLKLKGTKQNKKSGVYISSSNIYDNPDIEILEIQNIPFIKLLDVPRLNQFKDKIFSSFYFSGDFENLSCKMQFYNPKSLDTYLELKGDARNLLSDDKEFNLDFDIPFFTNPLSGHLYLANSQQKWLGFWDVKKYVHGNFKLVDSDSLNEAPMFEFSSSVSNFPIFEFLPSSKKNKWEALANFDMKLYGKLDNLSGEMNLNLNDIILNQVGYYSLKALAKLKNNKIQISKVYALLNNMPVLNADAEIDLNENNISAQIYGDSVETSFVIETLFKKKNIVSGYADYFAELSGSFNKPVLKTYVTIPEGIFWKEKITDIFCSATDSLKNYNFFKKDNHSITIDSLYYNSVKGYNFIGSAQLPLNLQDSMKIDAKISGNFFAHLPRIEKFFQKAIVEGTLQFIANGSLSRPKIDYLKMNIQNGTIEFRDILKPLTNIKALLEKKRNDPFIKINGISGDFDNYPAWIYNKKEIIAGDKKMPTWNFDALGIDLGVLILKTGTDGIPLNIYGLQEKNVFGYFSVSGYNQNEEFYFAGPVEEPHARGSAKLRNARVTFPFLTSPNRSKNKSKTVRFLEGINLDIKATAAKGVYYFVDIPAYIGSVYLDLDVDRDSHIHFTGKVEDESIRLDGDIIGKRGRVEYLETRFKVEEFGAFFNQHEIYPEVFGKAYTTLRDSMNVPVEIFLQLYAVDPSTKQEVQRGRWEDFRFKLVSSDPAVGNNQEMVLAKMGYSVGNIKNKAQEIGTQLTENYVIRPLVKPIERFLERKLKLDYVRFKSAVAKNLLTYSLGNRADNIHRENSLNVVGPNIGPKPSLLLLQSSEFTFGKYMDRNLFLSYSAQLMSLYESSDLEVNQKLNLEYRFFKNWLLEIEYDYFKNLPLYYNYRNPHDMTIRLRHSFTF